jgi:hypothetical protein
LVLAVKCDYQDGVSQLRRLGLKFKVGEDERGCVTDGRELVRIPILGVGSTDR